MRGLKKSILTTIGLIFSLLIGSVSVQGGNYLSLAKRPKTKLEPVYLVCVLNNMRIPEGDFELKILKDFEQVSKHAAQAMQMVKRFDFRSMAECRKVLYSPPTISLPVCVMKNYHYKIVAKNIVKMYPALETIGLLRDDMEYIIDIKPYFSNTGIKCLDVWDNIRKRHPCYSYRKLTPDISTWEDDMPHMDELGDTIRDTVKDMNVISHGDKYISCFKFLRNMDEYVRLLNDRNITCIGCIYCMKDGYQAHSRFLTEIRNKFPNVKVFKPSLERNQNYNELFAKDRDYRLCNEPLCMIFFVKHHDPDQPTLTNPDHN